VNLATNQIALITEGTKLEPDLVKHAFLGLSSMELANRMSFKTTTAETQTETAMDSGALSHISIQTMNIVTPSQIQPHRHLLCPLNQMMDLKSIPALKCAIKIIAQITEESRTSQAKETAVCHGAAKDGLI